MTRANHAKYVVDASVVAKWFTRHDEPYRERALALRERHQTGRSMLQIPEFGLLEIANAVRFGAKADEEDAHRALQLLEKLRLETVPLDWGLLREASSIAWASRVSVYDALYVAVAERVGVPFVTADDALVRKVKGHELVIRLDALDFS